MHLVPQSTEWSESLPLVLICISTFIKAEITDQNQISNPLRVLSNVVVKIFYKTQRDTHTHTQKITWDLLPPILYYTMMLRWNRKKTHFPLIAILSLVFIVFTILYNERSIRQIQENPDHVLHHQQAPVTFVKANRINPAQGIVHIIFFFFFFFTTIFNGNTQSGSA